MDSNLAWKHGKSSPLGNLLPARGTTARAIAIASLSLNTLVLLGLLQGCVRFSSSAFFSMFSIFQPDPWADPLAPVPYNLSLHISEHFTSVGKVPNCLSQSYLIPPPYRDEIGAMLESMGSFHVGVEIGVQRAIFSEQTLRTWPSCTHYYLIDLWGHQDNYTDSANVDDEEQHLIYLSAKSRLAPYANKTTFFRMKGSQAVSLVPNELDYVYIDARHDECAVTEDIDMWWPKVRQGGILAGHDYRGASAVWPNSDWSLCENGERHPGAVIAAVNKFAMKHGLQVLATWGKWEWSSWMIRKPWQPLPCPRQPKGRESANRWQRWRSQKPWGMKKRVLALPQGDSQANNFESEVEFVPIQGQVRHERAAHQEQLLRGIGSDTFVPHQSHADQRQQLETLQQEWQKQQQRQ